jgi:spore coat polysaccharide biosynthesis predicted glycosyltransferase SpsG
MGAVNILFKIMGSPEIGLGHVMRSLELASELKKDLEGKIFFHCNSDKRVIEKIEDKYAVFLTKENVDVNADIADKVMRYDIDILILDQMAEFMNLSRLVKLKKPDTLIVALDYFNYENSYLDIILNLYNHNRNVPNPEEEFTGEYYEGLEYAIIRDSFGEYVDKEKRIKENVNEILVTFGGSDTSENTIKVLNLLKTLSFSEAFFVNAFLKGLKKALQKKKYPLDTLMNDTPKVNIVIGPMFKNKDRIIEIAEKQDRYEIYQDAANMEELIFNADLGFIGSGTTLMEFCALGTPAIVMPQNEREQRFANLFEKNDAIRILKEGYPEEEKITLINEIISSKEIREEMSRNQRQLIDGKGKERIKKIILSRAK